MINNSAVIAQEYLESEFIKLIFRLKEWKLHLLKDIELF